MLILEKSGLLLINMDTRDTRPSVDQCRYKRNCKDLHYILRAKSECTEKREFFLNKRQPSGYALALAPSQHCTCSKSILETREQCVKFVHKSAHHNVQAIQSFFKLQRTIIYARELMLLLMFSKPRLMGKHFSKIYLLKKGAAKIYPIKTDQTKKDQVGERADSNINK